MNQHELRTEIQIEAPPEQVWAILTDFTAYPVWNPFITAIHGVPEAGTLLRVQLRLNGGKPMALRPRVVAAHAPHEFRWLGKLLLPGIFDGEHRFTIEGTPRGGSLFRQEETFSGILVPLFRGSLLRKTRDAFEKMNQALKARAETLR
ncbi:MAG: SRPBCC domain-containing protein [Bacteroidia bacterium]|nr:SRPBCC domain-containing protein [Bacteroidia bacterium]